jgi:hypothetical protein
MRFYTGSKKDSGEKNMFSGLLFCADCGATLNFHFNQGNHDIQYFNCRNYNSGKTRKLCTATHYVRVDFLEQVVLGEIRRLTKFAGKYEDEFVQSEFSLRENGLCRPCSSGSLLVMGHSKQTAAVQRQAKQTELSILTARDKELDKLFKRMWEDNGSGKIDNVRFSKMSKQYDDEQKDVLDKIKAISTELEKTADKSVTTEAFIKTVRKYTRAKRLTEIMLNELIEKIEVHHAIRENGVNMQRLTIHYACVGSIEIPNLSQIPRSEVTVHTRQGVATSYLPSQSAM